MAGTLLLLAIPAASFAQTSAEVHEGQSLAGALRSGARDCSQLSEDQFEVICEHAMDSYLGNRSLHEAMNAQMTRMMGASGERAMHVGLGHR